MNLVIENIQLSEWKITSYSRRKRHRIDEIRLGEFKTGINIFDSANYGSCFIEELGKGKTRRRDSKEKIYLNNKKDPGYWLWYGSACEAVLRYGS